MWIVQSFADDSIVTTRYGSIQGKVTSLGRAFTSIPYAAPPINDLRFENPRAPSNWTNVLHATSDPPGCPQMCTLQSYMCPQHQSEDCLYLNVFTPPTTKTTSDKHNTSKTSSNDNLSVMVWIHGGSYVMSYSGGWLFNSTNFAYDNNVIVVTLNYRLGILGSLYDTENSLFGNYGYLDQKFAIQWVYDNIEQFGGNKKSITIFGESGGASAVTLHLIDRDNIENGSIFNAAIVESSPVGAKLRYDILSEISENF